MQLARESSFAADWVGCCTQQVSFLNARQTGFRPTRLLFEMCCFSARRHIRCGTRRASGWLLVCLKRCFIPDRGRVRDEGPIPSHTLTSICNNRLSRSRPHRSRDCFGEEQWPVVAARTRTTLSIAQPPSLQPYSCSEAVKSIRWCTAHRLGISSAAADRNADECPESVPY